MDNSKIVAFQLTIELYEKLRKIAFDNHVSISEMLRILIENYRESEI